MIRLSVEVYLKDLSTRQETGRLYETLTSVNLMALLKRLVKTWPNRTLSHTMFVTPSIFNESPNSMESWILFLIEEDDGEGKGIKHVQL